MVNVLIGIYRVLFYITFVYIAYNLFLMIIGLLPRRQRYKLVKDQQKFCIFVPCHNEEKVIAATVDNLAKMTYNPDLFDVYFIADNCADNTVGEINKRISELGLSNFYALERNVNDPKKKGKPHALKWAIEKLEAEDKFYNKYDMFVIFDADNFVDSNILEHINSQYLSYKEGKRPELIQCYLDSKNRNNIVARGYYVSYRMSNGFLQNPRQKLGLNACIGGTGFATTTSFLKEIGGYHCTSLTEDLEIQTQATIKGKRITFNYNARIYDEKPTGVKQSFVQRIRWAQGYWFCMFKYEWRLFLSLFNIKKVKSVFRKIDNMLCLASVIFLTLGVVMLLIGLGLDISNIIRNIAGMPRLEINSVPYIIRQIAFYFTLFYYILVPLSSLYDGKMWEKKRVLISLIPDEIAYIFYTFTYIPITVIGLFKCHNQKTWKKTSHKVTKMECEEVLYNDSDKVLDYQQGTEE